MGIGLPTFCETFCMFLKLVFLLHFKGEFTLSEHRENYKFLLTYNRYIYTSEYISVIYKYIYYIDRYLFLSITRTFLRIVINKFWTINYTRTKTRSNKFVIDMKASCDNSRCRELSVSILSLRYAALAKRTTLFE